MGLYFWSLVNGTFFIVIGEILQSGVGEKFQSIGEGGDFF